MAHKHSEPVEDCFGCKVNALSFAAIKSRQGPNPIETVPVVAEEGARAGKTVGRNSVHWDGRQDATVFAPLTKLETKATEF
jgi:hypothetical protein